MNPERRKFLKWTAAATVSAATTGWAFYTEEESPRFRAAEILLEQQKVLNELLQDGVIVVQYEQTTDTSQPTGRLVAVREDERLLHLAQLQKQYSDAVNRAEVEEESAEHRSREIVKRVGPIATTIALTGAALSLWSQRRKSRVSR